MKWVVLCLTESVVLVWLNRVLEFVVVGKSSSMVWSKAAAPTEVLHNGYSHVIMDTLYRGKLKDKSDRLNQTSEDPNQ